MNRTNIVVTSDDNYIQHLGVMLTSMFDNTHYAKSIDIYFLDHGIEEKNKNSIIKICEKYGSNLFFVQLNKDIFKNFHVSEHINQVTYYRIIAPKLLPQDVQKLIYLDSDVIVEGDIYDFFNCDISGYTIGAIHDPHGYERIKELKIKNNRYFNAGVLLINVNRWRELNYTEKLINFININNSILRYWDQDALNALLYEDWTKLHPKWNLQTSFYNHEINGEEYQEAFQSPGIIHFTTFKKPWGLLCEHPLKHQYYKYLIKTEWADYSPLPNNVQQILKSNSNIYIFGAGGLGKAFYSNLFNHSVKVIGFIDNDQKKWESKLFDKVIFSPEILNNNMDDTKVIVCSMYADEISNQLIDLGLQYENIVKIKYL